LLPKDDETFDARFRLAKGRSWNRISSKVDYRGQPLTVAPGATAKAEMNFFAGAKKLSVLTDYEDQLNIPKLDLAVDFGVLYFLTKPIYHVLSYMGNYLHEQMHWTVSFGVSLCCC
jgi:YidC/Oxa1 family membrane protein insertase